MSVCAGVLCRCAVHGMARDGGGGACEGSGSFLNICICICMQGVMNTKGGITYIYVE